MLVPKQQSNELVIEGMRIQQKDIAELRQVLLNAQKQGDRYLLYDSRLDATKENVRTARERPHEFWLVRVTSSPERSISIKKVLRVLERQQGKMRKRPKEFWRTPGKI